MRQFSPALSGVSMRTSYSLQPASKRRQTRRMMPGTSAPAPRPRPGNMPAPELSRRATRRETRQAGSRMHPPLGTSFDRCQTYPHVPATSCNLLASKTPFDRQDRGAPAGAPRHLVNRLRDSLYWPVSYRSDCQSARDARLSRGHAPLFCAAQSAVSPAASALVDLRRPVDTPDIAQRVANLADRG